MGASCGKGYAGSVQPEPGEGSAEVFGKLQVDDSAADCIPAGYRAKRRQAVSAEVATLSLDQPYELKKVHKSTDAEEGIRTAMQHCFLFADLEEEQRDDVVHTMFKRAVTPGETLIREGQEGDNFYIIESGHFKVTKADGDQQKLLFEYHNQGAFGELALMYNCPRAATVTAESAGVVWCMERSTFRSIIVVSSMQKRQRYEECLAAMPLFAALTPDQRAAIADCLSLETFQVGWLAGCAVPPKMKYNTFSLNVREKTYKHYFTYII